MQPSSSHVDYDVLEAVVDLARAQQPARLKSMQKRRNNTVFAVASR